MALSYDVNAVIHCGAQVNLILPYGALHSANVVGTQMVVAFCMDGKLKPLHYISTSDVFPENLKNCQETHNMLEFADQLQHGYGQSKWLAEQIVNSASTNGLPVVISRFGNIAGSQTLPVWNENDLILLILRGVILSRTAPDIDWKVELSPVDFIAESIVKLTMDVTTYFGKKFNFVNSHTMDCRNLWQYLQKIGYEINIVPYKQWTESVQKTAAHFDNLKPLVQLLSTRLKTDDYLTNASTFAQDNVNKLLSDCGATYPRFNNIMLNKYMKTLMDGQYIPAPPRHDSTQCQLTNSVNPPLNGKVALVTGASSGIGRAIAKQLTMSGILTVAVARRIDKLMELQNESEYTSTLVPMKVDVTNRDEVFSCISQVKANVGSIDILVNSAGSMDYCKMVDCQLDSWVKMVELNCIGLLNVTAAVLPHMKGSKSGHIVNITSDAGRKPFAGLAVYSGTKYFGECVSEAMRQELVPYNIKVTCIQPGDTTTELHGKTKNPELLAEYGTQAEYLRAEDVANAVLYALNQPSNCAVNSILLEPIGAPI
ncbi:hypothetical protein HA402_004840 [Bradysia odoriphaga]|nr:hypothetical protein HA402_004840 [Bradysia odoriphaga]